MSDDIPNQDVESNEYSTGDLTWSMICACLIFLMIPGLGLFYSGLARHKNALSMMMLCMISLVIGSLQWFLFGFSLAFSKTGGLIIGNFDNSFLMGVGDAPAALTPRMPELLFMLYQGMFAAITPAIAVGGTAERGRLVPAAIFISLWSLTVYYPIACWIWSPNGWGAKLGVLDFAGGSLGHIATGTASLVYSWFLGPRIGHPRHKNDIEPEKSTSTDESSTKPSSDVGISLEYEPHNISMVVLGTGLIWFGWFGFNGGSALGVGIKTVVTCANTNFAAAGGAFAWMAADYIKTRNISAIAFCNGAVAGLVSITPGAGYVNLAASPAIGIIGALACRSCLRLQNFLRCDDAIDIVAIHGVGGFTGCILTGIFARQSISALSPAAEIAGGVLDNHWMQLPIQLADCMAAIIWSGLWSAIILLILSYIPGLHLRVDQNSELRGLDYGQMGVAVPNPHYEV